MGQEWCFITLTILPGSIPMSIKELAEIPIKNMNTIKTRRSSRLRLAITVCIAIIPVIVRADTVVTHLAPMLMESTFRIEGPGPGGGAGTGTCFLLSQPMRTNASGGWNLLITANHVLEGISSDQATLILRMKHPDGTFTRTNATLQIRKAGTPLWTRHPTADVAVLMAALPADFIQNHQWVTAGFLAGDDEFSRVDIRPGDELMCLGYPFGIEANSAGFPILRSGRVASYPVAPSTNAPTLLFDMPVYGGNSGGPVFFDFRKRDIPGIPQEAWCDTVGIAGLITEDISQTSYSQDYFETVTRRNPLGLAIVVPAEFIKQTIQLHMKKLTGEPPAQLSPLPAKAQPLEALPAEKSASHTLAL